jgi:phosphoglycerate dehydrogenase-like enzyme
MAAIAILDDYQRVALSMADWSRLQAAHALTVFDQSIGDADAVAATLRPFEIVAIMRERTPFPRSLLERLPNLKLLVTSGHRNAAIDMQAAADCGVTVCGTEAPGHATAELAIGLMIALSRHIAVEAQAMRGGAWQTTIGRDLRGRTLGLIGLGRLGGEVAKVARALGMPVIAWSENLTAERASEAGATRVDKDDLFRRSDVISIHTRLSPRTRHLVDARAFDLMKRDALLINTSRGPIVEEAALIDALRAGKIGGAALDVYDIEPLPADHPFRTLHRVLATPHLGYVTEETYRVFYGGTVAAIEAWLADRPIHVIPV